MPKSMDSFVDLFGCVHTSLQRSVSKRNCKLLLEFIRIHSPGVFANIAKNKDRIVLNC